VLLYGSRNVIRKRINSNGKSPAGHRDVMFDSVVFKQLKILADLPAGASYYLEIITAVLSPLLVSVL
jgi:hypothetical protein